MFRKFAIVVGSVAAMAVITLVSATGASAHQTQFTPVHTMCLWQLAPNATEQAPFVAPQTLVTCGGDLTIPSTCGKGYQLDHYSIETAKEETDFEALIKSGTLVGPSGDNEFHPSNWSVQVNAACVVDTPTPTPTPTPVVVTTTVTPSKVKITPPTKTKLKTPTKTETAVALVKKTPPTTPPLAFTGFNSGIGAGLGILVLGTGLALMLLARRVRGSRSH